ncbi:MAG TPA: GvpL/GvpF family gas vesicle protein [Candidatus Limnocylindrales bacterium]|nr:GvpL/GvpF family gas vesicle protein [Candidatus Limnocylindrales bacterium]
MSDLLYLYAIVPAEDAASLGSARGIDGGSVRAVVEGQLAGVVGAVPSSDFEAEPLNENVRSADWLRPRAAAHQEVNAALLADAGAVVPCAFGTIFREERGVRELLRSRAAELAAKLDRVRGRAEWVVTLERLAPAAVPARERAPAASGRGYLERRRGEQRGRADAQETAVGAAAALEDVLRGCAEDVAPEPLVAAAGPVAGRWTVLVKRSRAAGLARVLEAFEREWADRGLVARATGPWPAYRTGGA